MDTTSEPAVQDHAATRSFSGIRNRFRGRRLQVFDQLLRQQSEKLIAAQLNISTATVHGHVKSIYAILQIHSRNELRDLVSATPRLPVHRSVEDMHSSDNVIDEKTAT